MAEGKPNQTLYIKNINERLSRSHRLDELKSKLRNLCKPGEVIDIVALSNFHDKGQAFVVMKNVEQAAAALKKLKGYELEGQELKVAYARTKSNVAAKMDGTFMGYTRRVRARPSAGKKPMAMDDDDEEAPASEDDEPKAPPPPAFAPPPPVPMYGQPPPMQAPPGFGGPPPPMAHMPPAPGPPSAPAVALPHPILFLENLPEDATVESVSQMFRQFMGFKEVRLVPSRPGIAFVEFDNEMQSGVALNRLQGFQMQGKAIKISFSKS